MQCKKIAISTGLHHIEDKNYLILPVDFMIKFALIPLSFVYMLSVTGIGINSFYCCGKLESKKILTPFNHKADKDDRRCCQYLHNFYKVDDRHVNTNPHAVSLIKTTPVNIPYIDLVEPLVYSTTSKTGIRRTNAPPLIEPIPVYLQNCTFRI